MNKWEKEVQQSLLKDEQRILKVLKMAYADVLRETNDRMADLFARITADPTDSSTVYQFRYQQQLQEQLEKILDGFADGNYKTISEYLEKSYENGYLGAMYDIHKQGIPVVTPIQQEQVVRAVTLDSKISIPMYTRLGNNIAQLKTAITAEVTRGAASGSMWKDVAARISDKGNVAAYNAMRIARTEGHRIQCAAQMDACRSAREAGADVVKQWDSTMDDRTRETHRQLHGQLRELDVPFEVGGMTAMYPGAFGRPEEDIHCRCALLQRARWALSESELQALRETDAAKELAEASGFEDFRGKYLEMLDKSGESGIMELRGDGNGSQTTEHWFEQVGNINPDDNRQVAQSLVDFEAKYRDSDIEHCLVISKSGEMFEVHGDRHTVDTSLVQDKLKGSINEHNHVTGESKYSFSWEDLFSGTQDGSSIMIAYDEKFRYSMQFSDRHLSEDEVYDAYQRAKESVGDDMIFHPESIPEGDEQHERIRRACEELGIRYSRKELAG